MAPGDFKSRSSRGSKPKSTPRPAWLYFLLGAVTGAALTAFLYLNEFAPAPLYVPPRGSETEARGDAEKPETARAAKPRFEFYTMLPEMEVAVPDSELASKPSTETGSRAPDAPAGDYYLQAGSFRLLEEADKMKANLAFLGLEASIQTVTINGTDTWHRVRVGPYPDLASLNEARTRMRQNEIESIVLKVRK